LLERHPVAVIAIQDLPDSTWRSLSARRRASMQRTSWSETSPPILLTREGTAAPVLAAQGFDAGALQRAAGQPLSATPLANLRLTLVLRHRVRSSAQAPNVVGILEGSDPRLKQEYVVFSAHMDHVGVGRPDARGDSIYNGADDDASGTAAVMELAQAFAQLQPRPKRSLIFLAVSGEERGLWGSSYFTARPPVPIGNIVADLNSDMVGRNWKDTIVVIGRQHSDLGATLARVNAAHPELNMTAIDDIWPQERFYFRSDHYNFARRGVPILFFFNGVHADYHRPSDEPAKIDAEKESRIIQLVFYLGLEVANAAERPKWNPESYREIVEVR
jgi:Zn-dependent M28 family amino/carboxypeptidase